MTEFNREDIGDRLDNLDLLRDMIVGEQLDDYQVKINALQAQMNSMRQEMKAQGDQVQNTLNQKIDEVLNALQVSQFSTPPNIETPVPPPPPTQQLPQPLPTPSHPIPASTPAIELNPPRSPLPESSASPSPKEIELSGFFDQINSILQDDGSDFQGFADPTPEPIAPPPPPPSIAPSIAPSIPQTPPSTPAPEFSQEFSQEFPPELTTLPTDEATQLNQLRNLLLDEDLIRLRQTNNTLDVKLRQVEICLANQRPIQNLLPLMMELLQLKLKATPAPNGTQLSVPKKAFPWRIFSGFMLLLSLIPLGWYSYRLWREYRLEKKVEIALTADPELALYRLNADVKGKQLALTGSVPNEIIRDQAAKVSNTIASTLILDNQIAVVNPESLKRAEIQQILDSFNGKNGMQITSQLEGDRLTLNGIVFREKDLAQVMTTLENRGDLQEIINDVQIELQPIKAHLYFDQNSAAVKPDDIDQKLTLVQEFLQQNPDLKIRIIGYQHPTETAADVALKRAQATQILLENQEIDRRRMIALGVNQAPPNVTSEEPIWLSRAVFFEIVFPN